MVACVGGKSFAAAGELSGGVFDAMM